MGVIARIWKYPDTYVKIGDEKKPPGTYYVKKGTLVSYMCNVKNHGTAGEMFIQIKDKRTGKIITRKEMFVNPGEVRFLQFGGTQYQPATYVFEAGQVVYRDYGKSYIVQDSYGDWVIEIKPEGTNGGNGGGTGETTKILGLPWYVWLIIILLGGYWFMSREQ